VRRLGVLGLVSVAASLWAADDGVFDSAVDLAAPETVVAPATPGLRWSGSTLVEFGAVVPPLSGGALTTSTLAIDADPQSGVHARTALVASVPGAPALAVSELWAQVSPAPSWFVRLGVQPLTWQTARVFPTVDLASHVGADLSVRGQLIAGPVTIDALASAPVPADQSAWGQVSLASTSRLVSLASMTSAGRVELAIPLGALALAVRQSSYTEASGSLRLTLGPVDLFGEAVVQHRFGQGGYFPGTVVGFFTEVSTVQLYGEWTLDHRRDVGPPQNQTALAARWLHLLVPSGQVGVEWRHSLSDGTGRVLPGISAELLPGVRTDLGLSYSYHLAGPSGLYFTDTASSAALIGSRIRLSISY